MTERTRAGVAFGLIDEDRGDWAGVTILGDSYESANSAMTVR